MSLPSVTEGLAGCGEEESRGVSREARGEARPLLAADAAADALRALLGDKALDMALAALEANELSLRAVDGLSSLRGGGGYKEC